MTFIVVAKIKEQALEVQTFSAALLNIFKSVSRKVEGSQGLCSQAKMGSICLFKCDVWIFDCLVGR